MSPEISEMFETIRELLPFLIPVLLIQWGLMVFALVKLLRAVEKPRYLPVWAWVLIILFVNIIGPVLYLTLGRGDE